MTKTTEMIFEELEEISNTLEEWQKKNPKERSVLLIAGFEEGNILTTMEGSKPEIIGNIATKIIKDRDVTEVISQAIRIALEYANEKTECN